MDKSDQSKFLENIKSRRNERHKKIEIEQERTQAAVCIQKTFRGWIARTKFKKEILDDFSNLIPMSIPDDTTDIELKPNLQVYKSASRFLLVSWKSEEESEENRKRFEGLCRYLLISLDSESPKLSYVGLALNKEHSLSFINHLKQLLFKCCTILDSLKPETHSDTVSLALILRTLVAFTCPNGWCILKNKQLIVMKPAMQQICNNVLGFLIQKGFFISLRSILVKGTCRSVVALKPVSLNAVITLSIRPLINANFTQNLLMQFICHVLSIPALIYHIEQLTPSTLKSFQSRGLFKKCVDTICEKDNFKFIANSLQGAKLLALTANLIHLYNMEPIEVAQEMSYRQIIFMMKTLFETIPDTVEQRGTCSQWHELLGWYNASKANETIYENLSLIKKQVNLLWSHKLTKMLFGDHLKQVASMLEKNEKETNTSSSAVSSNSFIKKAIELKSGIINKSSKSNKKFDSNDIQRVALTCAMYYEALVTLPQLKLDILSGICYNGTILKDLWTTIISLGIKSFIDVIRYDDVNNPPALLLLLFCESMTHYVTILDDLEMYEQQTLFSLDDYIILSHFLNNLLFKTVHENIYEAKVVFNCPLFVSMHTLLLCLYRRDNRRAFAPENHWIIKDIKPAYFLMDLEKGKKHVQLLLQKMPHIISHQERVALFRKYVQNEKAVLGLTDSAYTPSSALVTVHRDRIVEDGYRQLAALPPRSLKGIIRVRFINQQGLDEAGIDQDGVFKEFLEETIKRVFDPSLNLFKMTAENRLYPSPTSHLQENHLQLFEFVGRILGKALYEGILVDVPFASFFLSLVLGQTQQAFYSCIDELPSLDKDLYKSLTFIKHYEGDVSDLDLTFSVDEDVMGKIITHELVPGGRLQQVTNDNRINYIHSMAFFRMHTQIWEQTSAFIRGFRSIINSDWLSLFSMVELQRLISGDTNPLDLKDLRRNTQYFGGFHDSHRVIGWLWDILAKDFTEEERRLFLKFVTSCSRPPLLGFAHMEPQFSIRCVEVGDTIGSVIRGFFTIRKREPLLRLPSSSTCFNLLKLPNYQKKSTLRDKLRYAITSNTGFELS
ncbi:CLUMA_CG013353, isoform A [Clunio marinus]|uniref:HECT-type E3 ubiquitin transferase n=1 Tax=Clunio marinus TaxID=568069 RepID=A0A1J1IIK9_9DIPT|nr:CLUMA_CG013353, isoform A [Clunio marinus]